MVPSTNAQLGKLLASYLSTSTLQNELLAKIANKKLIFVVSLQRKSKKMQNIGALFFDFRYNRGESDCYVLDKVIHRKQQSHSQTIPKFTFFGIIIV